MAIAFRPLRALCVATLLLLSGFAQWASADPPSRVGRITHTEAGVSFYSDREQGWQPARLNQPVSSENSLWTEGNVRAELRFGASAVRLDRDSIFDVIRLDDQVTSGFLQRGSINVRLRGYGSVDFEDRVSIETSQGLFIMEGSGRYRLEALPANNESRIAVFAGRARFEHGDTRLTIETGKELVVRADTGGANFRFVQTAETAFDQWAEGRDRQWDRAHSRYVGQATISPYMTGYEELDDHGEWIEEREYGRVWAPRLVSAGWAPYRYGRWTYARPWGWTWIDDAPWGFAPFHYGRWVSVRGRWCWWPGSYYARPVYAPALVAWFGGAGASLTISAGPGVGWFPLAPHEYFVPHYAHSPTYVRQINYVTNNITIINPPARYANRLPGATYVTNNVFINGSPVGSHLVRPPQSHIDHPVVGNVDLRPNWQPRREMGDRTQGLPQPRFGPLPPAVSVAPPGAAPVSTYPTAKQRPQQATSGPLPVQKAPPQPAQGGALPAPATVAAPQPVAVYPAKPAATPAAMPDRDNRGQRSQGGRYPAEPAAAPVAVAPQPVQSSAPPVAVYPARPADPAAAVPDRESRGQRSRGGRYPAEPAAAIVAPAPPYSAPSAAGARPPVAAVQPAPQPVPAPAKPPAEHHDKPKKPPAETVNESIEPKARGEGRQRNGSAAPH